MTQLLDQYGRPLATGGGTGFEDLLNKARQGVVNTGQELRQRAAGAGQAAVGAGKTGLGYAGQAASIPMIGAAAPALYGAGSIGQGQLGQGIGEIGGGLVGERLSGGVAKAAEAAVSRLPRGGALLAPIAGGAVRLAGGLLGGAIGGGIGRTAQNALAGAPAAAAQAAAQTQMGQGVSPGVIPGVGGVGIGFNDKSMADALKLSYGMGQQQVDVSRQMLPIANEFQNAQLQRAMQLAQQTGQITGALNRQLYMSQLAQGSQQESGATTRAMLTAQNPYAASAFQSRG